MTRVRPGLRAVRACARRERPRRPTGPGGVVAALVVLNVLDHLAPTGHTWLAVTGALLLLAQARRSGLGWDELGLGPDRLATGAAWALASAAAVAAVYLLATLHPATRVAFLDDRYDLAPAEALLTALVTIPVRTVLLEEVAFRSVLWGTLGRRTTMPRTLAASAGLFGLWHVLPSFDLLSANRAVGRGLPGGAAGTALGVVATVAFTAAGGAVMGELRRRSDSVLAGAGLHWATNGLGVLVGVAVRRAAGRGSSSEPSPLGAAR